MDGNDPPKTSMKSRGPYIGLVLVLIALGLAGVGTWLVLARTQVQSAPDAGTPPPVVDAGAPEPGLDPSQGDVLIGELVPKEWLAGGDVVRRAATAVYAVSMGESPRLVLPFLDPGGTFIVDEQKGKKKKEKSRWFISEKNDARYDAVTATFTAIDAQAAGRLYGKLRPYLESAFKEIAPPGKTFDAAFMAAVDRLSAVPITDEPREVIPMEVGVGYTWADPKLEALKPAEKHLLRMGPKNARAVVKQLQAFRTAMTEADATGH